MRKKDGLFRNPIVNTSAGAVGKCCINEGIARYTPTTRLLQDYKAEDGARMWVSN